MNSLEIEKQKQMLEKYVGNTSNNIIQLTNMICCKIFENSSYQYYYYKNYDMEDNIDKIKEIFTNIKNNNLIEEDFNYIVSTLTNLLLKLKTNIIKIEHEKIYFKDLAMGYIQDIQILNERNRNQDAILIQNEQKKINQIKQWINKNVESEKKIKDLEIKLSNLELDNNKYLQEIENLSKKHVSFSHESYNDKINKLNNKNNKIIKESNELKNEINKLNEKINELTNNNNKIINKYNQLINNNNKLVNEHNILTNNYNKIVKEYNILSDNKKNFNKLSNENEELKINLDKLSNENKEIKNDLDKLTNENNKLNNQNKELKKNNYNLFKNYNHLYYENNYYRNYHNHYSPQMLYINGIPYYKNIS